MPMAYNPSAFASLVTLRHGLAREDSSDGRTEEETGAEAQPVAGPHGADPDPSPARLERVGQGAGRL